MKVIALIAAVVAARPGLDETNAKIAEYKASDKPRLRETLSYGWTSTRTTNSGNWGYESVIYADAGANYSFPLYDEDPYMIQ